jgi:hypothetical protein
MEEEFKENYYVVIPVRLLQDRSISSTAKLVYGQIVALSNKYGFCWAGNRYFAELFKVSEETIRVSIEILVKKGYLRTEIDKTNIKHPRKIFLCVGQPPQENLEKALQPLQENLESTPRKLGYNNKNKIIVLSKDKTISRTSLKELDKLTGLNKTREDLKIVFTYAQAIRKNFGSNREKQSFISRNIRAARLLLGYSLKKVEIWCKILPYLGLKKWTLETVGKFIDEDPIETIMRYREKDYDDVFRELEEKGVMKWDNKEGWKLN